MARRVSWTEEGWSDLEQIAAYIAQDSRFYAAAFVRSLRTAARSLDGNSERGRIVPELQDASIRELIVGNYRLIYRVTAETVFILAVLHGSRLLRMR